MKAMIFAAGLGTRLRPITDTKPKALVAVGGMTLLEIAIKRLKSIGCQDIIINIHHFGQQIVDYIQQNDHFEIKIQFSDESEKLLDTGGGLKKAAWFFDDAPFFVYNADILSDIDLKAMYDNHLKNNPLATLAVKTRKSSRQLLFDDQESLCGWENVVSGEKKIARAVSPLHPLAFSGIHVIHPAIFEFFPDDAVFSIIDLYLEIAKNKEIRGFRHEQSFLHDVGKLDSLEKAAEYVQQLFPKQQ